MSDSKGKDNSQRVRTTDPEKIRKIKEIRRKRREAQIRKQKMILGGVAIAVVLLIVIAVSAGIKSGVKRANSAKATAAKEKQTKEEAESKKTESVAEAEIKAAQYDYDGAIDLLKQQSDYDTNEDLQSKVKKYEETKASCTAYPLEQVTHVFYHSLIRDPAKAFDGDYKADGYNQFFTTIEEFNKITQKMYDDGFVMVSLEDMSTFDESGKRTDGEILLPPGKKPFVLSQDDLSYYHCYEGDGIATRLVVSDDGKVVNEYTEDDGSITQGDFDMVPLIDRFVEEHPDFSYRGAKGTVALTGYDGILGYHTDIQYQTKESLQSDQQEWLDAHPEFDFEADKAAAKKVADAMKAEGWEFASHTWGHQNISTIGLDSLQTDTQKFKDNVVPLIGDTDKIIFAFGADLTAAEDYSGEKFEYLKSQGYNYYCNVDSTQYFVQMRDNYFRMGRRNLDGYRMYYNPEMLEDLFDAKSVFDSARPTPVAPL